MSDSTRHQKQLAAFLATGAFTIAAAVYAKRSVVARRYRPSMFDANNRPPNFNFVKDAVQAVSHATTLSVSSFAFAIATSCWVFDIGSITEFGTAMKNRLGGAAREKELLQMPVDPEVTNIEQSLANALK